ncbi:MAG: hypothetical protein ABI166_09420 [Mucilaginibacter sp.]
MIRIKGTAFGGAKVGKKYEFEKDIPNNYKGPLPTPSPRKESHYPLLSTSKNAMALCDFRPEAV